MIAYLSDTLHLLMRHIRTTLRMPIWLAVTMIQPIIWLTMYGQLFRKVVDLPGFGASSYIQFLTPGVAVMTALFGSAWSGMGLIKDLSDGVIDRMLATPVHRSALITAPVLHAALTVATQCVLILLLGLVLGAKITGGVSGFLVVLLLAALLGAGFAALSHGVALLTRREETLIAIVNFVGLPLVFLSTAFMASGLMPGWILAIARLNPVNWAANAARAAMLGQNWGYVWSRVGILVAFAIVSAFLSSRAFNVYRRTT